VLHAAADACGDRIQAGRRTASLDDAAALTANGGSPNVRSGSVAKSMVWPARATDSTRETLQPARSQRCGLGGHDVHAPAAANVTRLPATAQAPAAERFTGSPDEAETATTMGGFPKIWSTSRAKVMAWVARRMVNVCETSSAGDTSRHRSVTL